MVASAVARTRVIAMVAAAALGIAACGGAGVDNGALAAAASAGVPTEVTVEGTVTSLDSGSQPARHQRFQISVNRLEVEVDHNLALAPRIPLGVGDTVVVHGQFEPDGGRPVIHYTHHATGRHEGGWIELRGQRYE